LNRAGAASPSPTDVQSELAAVADVIFIAVIFGFFGLAMLIVRWLHPIVLSANADEPDQEADPDEASAYPVSES
jgi:hypothetical protein